MLIHNSKPLEINSHRRKFIYFNIVSLVRKICQIQFSTSSLTFFHLQVKLSEQWKEGRKEGMKEDIFIQLMKQTQSGNNEELFLRIKANYIVIQSS